LALGTAWLSRANAFACAPSAKHNKSNAAKIAQGMPKHPNPAKAIAEVKQTHVERQALRNFTMPLAVGKA
jgi:hypothetical protein